MSEFRLEGLDTFLRALDKLRADFDAAARKGANAAAHAVESRTKAKLTTSTHRRGTPTPSRPGQPPSLVTGTGRRSVKVIPAVPAGAGAWEAKVGPTAVYMRIQELGGATGRRHATTLPPRPYLEPSVRELVASGELWAAFRSGWEV